MHNQNKQEKHRIQQLIRIILFVCKLYLKSKSYGRQILGLWSKIEKGLEKRKMRLLCSVIESAIFEREDIVLSKVVTWSFIT